MRSTPLKGILLFLIAISMGGYLFHAQIPKVYGEWTNREVIITPSSVTAYRGSTLTFNVQVKGTSAPNDPVELDVFYKYTPTDQFYPPWLTITLSPKYKPAPFTAIMTVHVSSSAQYGLHWIQIKAKAASFPFLVSSNTLELEVKKKVLTIAPTIILSTPTTPPGPTAPAFDFTLMLSPPSVTVEQGETANFQLQIAYNDPSYSGTQINYQVTGLGPGLNWVPAGGGAIPISTSPTASPGTYQVTVIGSAQGKTHQTNATLIVTESSPTTTDDEETATTLIEPTSPTAIEPTTVTITEQVATQTPTLTTELQTDGEGSDLTSQLLNPTVLMAIIIAVLATALITTLMRKRK